MIKDLAEQCRTLHFSIVGACFVLLLAVTSGLSNPDASAYKDITTVASLALNWKKGWMAQAVDRETKARFDNTVAKNATVRRILVTKGPDKSPAFLNIETAWYLTPDEQSPKQSPASVTMEDFEADEISTKRDSLDEFAKIWNLLGDYPVLHSLELVGGGLYFDGTSQYDLAPSYDSEDDLNSKGREPQHISNRFFGAVLVSKARVLELIEEAISKAPAFYSPQWTKIFQQTRDELKRSSTECLFIPSPKGWLLNKDFYFLEADCVDARVGFQQLFRAEVSPRPPTGHFETAFPDLDVVTKWIRSSPLRNLEKHVYDQSRRAGEKLEVLGVKIPAEDVSKWGAAALIGLFTLFWINLRALGTCPEGDRDQCAVAWIGTYRLPSARLIYLFSVLALPLVTALGLAWLGLKADKSWMQILISGCTTLVAIALVLAVAAATARLWGTDWGSLLRGRLFSKSVSN